MCRQRWAIATATALVLSGCGMLGMGSDGRSGSAYGDGSNTGRGNDAVEACRGLSGDALRSCLDRHGVNRATDRPR